MQGLLATNRLFPYLPTSITGTNAERTLKWTFEATSLTNVFGFSLPLEAVVGYTALFKSPEPWSTVVIKLREVYPASGRTSFTGNLNEERSVVYESTYKDATPSFEARVVTNNWPSDAEIEARYKQWIVRRPRARVKSNPALTYLLLSIVVIGPLSFLMFRSRRNRNQNPGDHHEKK